MLGSPDKGEKIAIKLYVWRVVVEGLGVEPVTCIRQIAVKIMGLASVLKL